MIAGLVYVAVGLLLVWVGWNHWRHRRQETVSVLEAAILKAADEDPLSPTRLDWFLKYLQAILGFTLGPIFFFLGVIVILNELDFL
jgi:TRAP-type C4-dicarboxylate transport system permease small subunit